MYEILVVDDSVLDIECISFLIQKDALPLSVTTAVNGSDALKLLENTDRHFDILLTDIKMPLMDGLELSRRVRKLSPDTRIIIFSGYHDFDYAKTAISLGVQDYLLKPIIPSDFQATLTKVIHSIEEMQRQEKEKRQQSHIIKSHLLWLFVNNSTRAEAYRELFEHYHAMMLIECEDDFFSGDGLHFQQKLTELVSFSFDYLNLYPTRSLLFIQEPKEEAYLISAASAISLYIREQFCKCYITFAFLSDNADISRTYALMDKKLETRFFFPEKTIFPPDDGKAFPSSVDAISVDLLKDDLKLGDYDSFFDHLEEILNSLKNEKKYSTIYVKYCFMEMSKLLLQFTPPSGENINELAEKIYGSDSITELISMIRKQADALLKAPSKDPRDDLKIEKIKQYIYQNYASPLSLNDIASHFYISPNYLCAIFKKGTGSNLTKFINDYRLKRASELLLSTEMKIHMIAEAVGYRNTSYFCQRFRDFYGETPELYRQKKQTI